MNALLKHCTFIICRLYLLMICDTQCSKIVIAVSVKLVLSKIVSEWIFRVHNVTQWSNLGHLGESLVRAETATLTFSVLFTVVSSGALNLA